ncbi:ABC transporter substrate-binding protein [Sulfitobacter pacificus]|uniref:ABC transporter permease n=1 Tax=Sulfitobacter pacificus TaxID=1499314 RepID=A0ABQ5VQL4_9RHOB|nr:ABC transporter substrate-binding protein [Sulfitobacter pacificus]GLQ29193.1 ABC transporter permease [Sulfitobacter pacificus]
MALRRNFYKTVTVAAAVAASAVLSLPAAATEISGGTVKIGVLNDQSGPYVDLAGPGSVLAAQMAVDDFGGEVLGAPIEILSADHQNKPDVGSSIVRRWFDADGVDAVADVPTSSVALAVQELVRSSNKVFLISGAASETLTGTACSPNSIQTADDTYALTHGTVEAAVSAGAKKWFFITADYSFGHTIENAARTIIEANGGEVVGSVSHPQNTTDFAQYILQAQASGAQAIGLANAGNDTVGTILQAAEFGVVDGGQQLVGMIMFSSDIKSLGLEAAQGLLLTEGFYWGMSPEAQKFSDRFIEQFKLMPTREQATTYATVTHYLKAIQAAGTDDSEAVMAKMKEMPVTYFGQTGTIREDGRFLHDLTLYEVKSPKDSKNEWDFYNKVADIPADVAFKPMSEGGCPFISK